MSSFKINSFQKKLLEKAYADSPEYVQWQSILDIYAEINPSRSFECAKNQRERVNIALKIDEDIKHLKHKEFIEGMEEFGGHPIHTIKLSPAGRDYIDRPSWFMQKILEARDKIVLEFLVFVTGACFGILAKILWSYIASSIGGTSV